MKIKMYFIALCVVIQATSGFGQIAEPKTKNEETKGTIEVATKYTATDYEDLLAKLKSGDAKIDYLALRLAFTETKQFAPYDGTEIRKEMNDALDKKDYKSALEAAEKRLLTNYTDVDAHFTAFVANRELDKSNDADFHRKITLGLVDSITAGADGKSAKTAFFVISIREEYFMIAYKGFQKKSQELLRENGHIYDILTCTDPKTDTTVNFYFNIDKVFGRF